MVNPVLESFLSKAALQMKCLLACLAAELMSFTLMGGMTTLGGGGGLNSPFLPRPERKLIQLLFSTFPTIRFKSNMCENGLGVNIQLYNNTSQYPRLLYQSLKFCKVASSQLETCCFQSPRISPYI